MPTPDKTYTFSSVSNPSTTHKAWHGPGGVVSPPSFSGASEASTTNYGQLATQDSPEAPWSTTGNALELDWQYYRFKLDEAAGSIATLTWDVLAMQNNTSPTIIFFYWNFNTEQWEQGDSQVGSAYTWVGAEITANIGYYIDASGYCYGAISATDTEEAANLLVDFVKLDVYLTPVSFIPRARVI